MCIVIYSHMVHYPQKVTNTVLCHFFCLHVAYEAMSRKVRSFTTLSRAIWWCNWVHVIAKLTFRKSKFHHLWWVLGADRTLPSTAVYLLAILRIPDTPFRQLLSTGEKSFWLMDFSRPDKITFSLALILAWMLSCNWSEGLYPQVTSWRISLM